MTPEQLLQPENLPDDLQWVVAHHRLQPNDPVFLLIAWHWQRIQQAEDSLRSATVELKSAVDHRIESLSGLVGNVGELAAQLKSVESALRAKPLELGARLEADLREPVERSVAEIRKIERSLSGVIPQTRALLSSTLRRQAFAAFLVGVFLGGGLVALWW